MVVLDQFTRRIVRFSTRKGSVTGIGLYYMFNKMINRRDLPKYLSSDNDPLFHVYRWKDNLRILDIEEIKSVPYAPTSHPFIERLIGTIRREILDKTFYWHANDLQNKLKLFQCYYNEERCHGSIDGLSPLQKADEKSSRVVSIHDFRWKKHCRELFQLPIVAQGFLVLYLNDIINI
jgi:putative transposase